MNKTAMTTKTRRPSTAILVVFLSKNLKAECLRGRLDVMNLIFDFSIPNRHPIAPSWISRTQTNSRLLFDHDPFAIAKVARLVDQLVAARAQALLGVAR